MEIKKIDRKCKEEITKLIVENWGSNIIVSKGRAHKSESLPGFYIQNEEQTEGFITYNFENDACEIVTLNSFLENRGIGTLLVNTVIEEAKRKNCKKIWLITTNDNTKAIRFYQKKGFEIVALHLNAIEESRKIKPEIPLLGDDGIPIKHEVEFEMRLKK